MLCALCRMTRPRVGGTIKPASTGHERETLHERNGRLHRRRSWVGRSGRRRSAVGGPGHPSDPGRGRRRPPAAGVMPAACPVLQRQPRDRLDVHRRRRQGGQRACATAGCWCPRGKMLGGSSGINYMAYVRGHPGDFDRWAAGGADRLELRRRPALLQEERGSRPDRRHPVDADAHSTEGPSACPCAQPVSPARRTSSRRLSPPASPRATTTAATAADPPASCRSCRRRRVTASGRARITPSSRAKPETRPNLE